MKKIKMFCFPYAGGSAAIYYKWKRYSDDIEIIAVELSGHGKRINERFYDNFDEMIQDCYNMVKENILPEDEYVFFGHSMGSILAYSLALKMIEEKDKAPRYLFLSGGCPPDKNMYKSIYELNDEEFIKTILQIGATKREVFENANLRKIFLPILRADFKMINTYKFKKNKKVNCDIVLLNGKNDYAVRCSNLHHWNQFTLGTCEQYYFTGDHFYILDKEEEIMSLIYYKLKRCCLMS